MSPCVFFCLSSCKWCECRFVPLQATGPSEQRRQQVHSLKRARQEIQRNRLGIDAIFSQYPHSDISPFATVIIDYLILLVIARCCRESKRYFPVSNMCLDLHVNQHWTRSFPKICQKYVKNVFWWVMALRSASVGFTSGWYWLPAVFVSTILIFLSVPMSHRWPFCYSSWQIKPCALSAVKHWLVLFLWFLSTSVFFNVVLFLWLSWPQARLPFDQTLLTLLLTRFSLLLEVAKWWKWSPFL